jgi:hypothetical protein
MKKASYVKGEYRGMYLYSILREEWRSASNFRVYRSTKTAEGIR